MILLRDLTKLEKEKLEAMREEILSRFRRTVRPVLKTRDGEELPIIPFKRCYARRAKEAKDRRRLVEDARSLFKEKPGLREFMNLLLQDISQSMGIPESFLKDLRDGELCECDRCRMIRRLQGKATAKDVGEPNWPFKIMTVGSSYHFTAKSADEVDELVFQREKP